MTAETNTTIDNPRLWRMALQLSPQALSVVLTSMVSDSSLRRYSIPLDPSQPYLKAIEDAIYSTPEILGDYGHIDLVARTTAYTVVPRSLDEATAIQCGSYMKLDHGDEDSVLNTDITDCASIVWAIPANVRNFLARTFRNAPVQSHIAPLMRYLNRQACLGNSAKLFAHFAEGQVDILAFAPGGSLALAATHPVDTDTDALYFIMACARQAGMDLMTDEILLCGEPQRRSTLMPLLSRYAARVMPLIFPSAALRAGREAFNAPFPLILIPICE